MDDIIKRIEAIAHLQDHYLVKAYQLSHPYFAEFIAAATVMKGLLNNKEFEIWLSQKMLLRDLPFSEKTFIQGATETAVARYFGERHPIGFRTEVKVNPGNNKDVDCQLLSGGYIFNVEVKCAEFKNKDETDSQDAIKYGTIGRLEDRGQNAIDAIKAALDEAMTNRGETLKPHVLMKSMDNNLKDYLQSAHEKFNPDAGENELNILLVGCDDADDMQRWFNYLYSHQGLFREDSYAELNSYALVDVVVFTNQYNKHHNFFLNEVSSSWTLDSNLILILQNPYSLIKKNDALIHFESLLSHHMEEFAAYEVPGSAEDAVKINFWVSHFIKDYLQDQNGIYLFAQKK